MKSSYSKPFLTVREQVESLRQRGLAIPSVRAAEAYFRGFNYYRFRGYCYWFEASHHPQHRFDQGTSFDHITALCEFDECLTFTLSRALRWVEIHFRTRFAYCLGEPTKDPFPHLDKGLYRRERAEDAQETLARLRIEAEDRVRGKRVDPRIVHLAQQYSEFPDLPIWALVEMVSLGTLSRLYGTLKPSVQKPIAGAYLLSPALLHNWLNNLTIVRNQCAHHGRLWDFPSPVEIRMHRRWPERPDPTSLFASIVCLSHLIASCNPSGTPAWQQDLISCIVGYLEGCPHPATFATRLGLTRNWQRFPDWSAPAKRF